MKSVTLAVQQALRAQELRVAFLFDADTSLGHVYAWSGAGVLEHDGNEYIGLGTLGQAQLAGDSTEVKTLQSQYTLSGPTIAAEAAKVSNSVVRGRTARFQMALLDEELKVIPDPILLDMSIMDTASVDLSESLEEILTIRGTSAVFDFARPLNQTISNESQQAVFPGDTGFDRIANHVVDKVVRWTEN